MLEPMKRETANTGTPARSAQLPHGQLATTALTGRCNKRPTKLDPRPFFIEREGGSTLRVGSFGHRPPDPLPSAAIAARGLLPVWVIVIVVPGPAGFNDWRHSMSEG